MVVQAIQTTDLTYEEIGKKFDISRARVAAIALEYGAMRNGNVPQIAERWKEEIIRRYQDGELMQAISERFGRDKRTIMRLLDRYSIPRRKPGRPQHV